MAIACRPLGVLVMEDEHGGDVKVLAVPITKVCMRYARWATYEDVPEDELHAIRHFFEHYKDLEPGKWVRVGDWKGPKHARKLIEDAVENFRKKNPRPDAAPEAKKAGD